MGATPLLAFVGFVGWCGVTLTRGVPSGARDLGAWVAAVGIALACPVDGARRVAERAAAIAGAAAALIAVVQRLAGARGIFVHGGQGNANWLGLLLAITVPLTLGLAVALRREGASRCSIVARASLVVQLVGLALSHSRVAWAASAIALSGLVFSLVRSARGRRLAIVAVVAASLVAVAIAEKTIVRREDAPASVAEGGDVPVPVAWQGRVWIWRSSADAAIEALPFGAGLGGFAHAYLDAQGKRLAPLGPKAASRRFLNATTAHSDWIEVLVDAGIPALALLAIAIAWGARVAMRDGWPAGAAALIAFAVCAAGDSPLRQPGVALLLGLVLAGCGARAEPRNMLHFALRTGALISCALLLAIAVSGWVAARRLTAAKEALPSARRALLASAARLDPRNGETLLERGLLELEEGDADAALGALRRSRALFANVGTDVAIGNAEVLRGDHEAAVAAYLAALRRHPGAFRAHANITQPLLALGRVDEAERHLAIAAALWAGHPRLGEVAEQIKRARLDRAVDR